MIDSTTTPTFPTLTLEGESWRQVKDYSPNYFVSNLGRILTTNHYGHKDKTAVMKVWTDKAGYQRTALDGKTIKVHRIVAQNWVENPLNKPEVNHIDCNPSNNNASNLEWVTHQENVWYTRKMGRAVDNRGENCGNHVLKEHQVIKIRKDTRKYKEIAEEYGVTVDTIKNVRSRRTWKHID